MVGFGPAERGSQLFQEVAAARRRRLGSAFGGSEPTMSRASSWSPTRPRRRPIDSRTTSSAPSIVHRALDEGGRSPAAQLLKQHAAARDAILQALTGRSGIAARHERNPEGTYEAFSGTDAT